MIFLDANYIINLYVKTNEDHERAKEIYKLIKNESQVISNLIIIEIITVMTVKLKQDPTLILKVHKELKNNYDIVDDTVFHEKGFEVLLNELKKNKERIPLFDCVYMALMRELGIKEIVSFDKHFDNKENITRIH